MSQWGNQDNAANSVLWVGSLVNKPANTTIRNAMFGNTTPGAFVTNLETGQFGISPAEMQSARENEAPRAAHAGWALRTEGTGGRAGRVQFEVLVAGGSITGDAADDALLPDFAIRILQQPEDAEVTSGDDAIFEVLAERIPTDVVLGYAWTYANGTAIAAGANVGPTNADQLTIDTSVQTSNASFIVTITGTGANTVTSDPATLTIV